MIVNLCELIYSKNMDNDSNMIIDDDDDEELLDCDFSLNDTPQDQFMHLINLAIEYGNIDYIKQGINEYKNIIDNSYIENANNIMMQILEEQIEEMTF